MTRLAVALIAESLAALLLSSIAIRILPFGRLAGLMRANDDAASPGERELADLRRAIKGWSRRLPWRVKCFEQGLAAHWLLLRRGNATTLYYGAAQRDGALLAHVWVRSGATDVIGCENAGEFVLLSQFTNVPS